MLSVRYADLVVKGTVHSSTAYAALMLQAALHVRAAVLAAFVARWQCGAGFLVAF